MLSNTSQLFEAHVATLLSSSTTSSASAFIGVDRFGFGNEGVAVLTTFDVKAEAGIAPYELDLDVSLLAEGDQAALVESCEHSDHNRSATTPAQGNLPTVEQCDEGDEVADGKFKGEMDISEVATQMLEGSKTHQEESSTIPNWHGVGDEEFDDNEYHSADMNATLLPASILVVEEVKDEAEGDKLIGIPNDEYEEHMDSLHESPTTEIAQWKKWVQRCGEVDAEYDECNAPFLSVPKTPPLSATASPIRRWESESIGADMSGLDPSTNLPGSPSPSACSSVDSPLISTPSTDLHRFVGFKFPLYPGLGLELLFGDGDGVGSEDEIPPVDHLFQGMASAVSFSALVACTSVDDVKSSAAEPVMIQTADCLFEGIPSLESYETLYLKSEPSLSPVFISSPCLPATWTSTSDEVACYQPWVPLYAATRQETASSMVEGSRYDRAGLLGTVTLWLRILSLFVSLFHFF